MSLMSLYQEHPDPKLHGLIKKMADSLRDVLKIKGEYAYYYDFQEQPADMRECKTGIVGYGAEQVYTQGSILRALSRWYEWSGDDGYRKLTEKMKDHLLLKRPGDPRRCPRWSCPTSMASSWATSTAIARR